MASALLERGYIFSSANSINWGRLAPQIVYYFSAYCDLVNSGALNMGESVDFCVPTGNFGNIFAGYLAKRMGLPVRKLICASNSNNILTDFLTTGCYDRNRAFFTTMSPSMDILISSNLERLLYLMAGPVKTAEWMAQLSKDGVYRVDGETLAKIKETFVGFCTNEEETAAVISETFENGYLCDTHTAVAIYAAEQYIAETKDTLPMVVDSTASPYKFANNVYRSVMGKEPTSDLDALDELSSATNTEIPYPLAGLGQRKINFTKVCDRTEMAEAVLDYIG
jgi:threonine synthase